jgi:hypothetical protein
MPVAASLVSHITPSGAVYLTSFLLCFCKFLLLHLIKFARDPFCNQSIRFYFDQLITDAISIPISSSFKLLQPKNLSFSPIFLPTFLDHGWLQLLRKDFCNTKLWVSWSPRSMMCRLTGKYDLLLSLLFFLSPVPVII